MTIRLIPYAVLEEMISKEPILLEFTVASTAEQVMEQLAQKYPEAAPILRATRLAREDEYVDKQTVLSEGAEYCLIPPVSGG